MRFELNNFRPHERQMHPIVAAALNRKVFHLPHAQWAKEVGLDGTDVRLDLVAVVHRDNSSRFPIGVHGIEVKMPDDADKARRDRQLTASLRHCDYTWLVCVNSEPTGENPDVGILYYDVVADDFRLLREAKRQPANVRPVLRGIRMQLQTAMERLYGVVDANPPPPPKPTQGAH